MGRAYARGAYRAVLGGRSTLTLGISKGDSVSEVVASTFVLAVTDLDASRAFYCEKLGFAVDLCVDGWSFLSRGACRLRLGHCPNAQPMLKCQDHSWFAYLHVTDISRLYEDVLAQGVEIWHTLQSKPWGMREFAIATPDGHRIVFGESISKSRADA